MKTQAFGWFAAAVLAAGLNASYHDGGLQWAHRAVDRMEHGSAAVVALASGHMGQFVAEAQLVANRVGTNDREMEARNTEDREIEDRRIAEQQVVRQAKREQEKREETRSCPWATAIARVKTLAQNAFTQTTLAQTTPTQAKMDRAENNWADFEAMSDRQQAKLARFEADQERLQARIEAKTAHLRAVAMNPAIIEKMGIPARCQTIHISAPLMPTVRIQDSVIHLNWNASPI